MDKTEKDLKELLDIAFQNIDLDSPKDNFTATVMKEINVYEKNPVFAYKPIVSKKILGLVLVLFMVLLGFLISQVELSSTNWFESTLVSKWMTKISVPLIELPFSRILVYAIGMMGLLIAIQTTLLKGYFDKRLA